MGKYGDVALRATRLHAECGSPCEAWKLAWRELSPTRTSKSCPRGAYLGLCEEGRVVGIPRGSYTTSRKNKGYAIKAVRLLIEDDSLAQAGAATLWRRVMHGKHMSENHQMDVVLTLWANKMIVREAPLELDLKAWAFDEPSARRVAVRPTTSIGPRVTAPFVRRRAAR